MPHRRDIRRLAMQVLYQIDLRGEADIPLIAEGLADGLDRPQVREEALKLALAAWQDHARADALSGELAPGWPTHRQPPVDRSILRLAHWEMVSGHAPVKVVINEAVELAKDFCAQQSPSFINGVLDKMARRLESQGNIPKGEAPEAAAPEAWLKDAKEGEQPA